MTALCGPRGKKWQFIILLSLSAVSSLQFETDFYYLIYGNDENFFLAVDVLLEKHFLLIYYSETTPTKATQQNSSQILQQFSTNYPCNQAVHSKATELWSFWLVCWKIIVNLYDI